MKSISCPLTLFLILWFCSCTTTESIQLEKKISIQLDCKEDFSHNFESIKSSIKTEIPYKHLRNYCSYKISIVSNSENTIGQYRVSSGGSTPNLLKELENFIESLKGNVEKALEEDCFSKRQYYVLIDATHEDNSRDPLIDFFGNPSYEDNKTNDGYSKDSIHIMDDEDLNKALIRNDVAIHVITIDDTTEPKKESFILNNAMRNTIEKKEIRNELIDDVNFSIEKALDEKDRPKSMILSTLFSTLIQLHDTKIKTDVFVFSDLEHNPNGSEEFKSMTKAIKEKKFDFLFGNDRISETLIVNAHGESIIEDVTKDATLEEQKTFIKSLNLSNVTLYLLMPKIDVYETRFQNDAIAFRSELTKLLINQLGGKQTGLTIIKN